MRRRLLVVLALTVLVVAGACGSDDDATVASEGGTEAEQVTLRLGYFPNVTHAPAIAGVDKGIFAKALGADVELKTQTFNAGPAAVEALLADQLDATFIGPNPAINLYSKDKSIRIVSGATSGGAALVVKPEITTPAQLKGKTLATPQRGNTQDVALRAWLAEEGLKTDLSGGGEVPIRPQENAQTLDTFKTGDIAGAWVPEPWVSRLQQEGGGKVLVDEKTLWPDGKFVTTHLIVRASFLEQHPDVVKRLVEGQVDAVDYVNTNTAEAHAVVNAGIEKITGKKLAEPIITAAWKNLVFTTDPISASLKKSATDAEAVGLLEKVDLTGIYDLNPLNAVLKAKGETAVTGF